MKQILENWERERDLREWENSHYERKEVSECCSAEVINGICQDCKEYADIILIKE